MPPAAPNKILVDAIADRRTLSFVYHGKQRIAEPQCYGIGPKGSELLRVHQLQGGTQAEPLFTVAEMQDLVVLDRKFHRPGPHYRKDDSAMVRVFAQL